MIDATELTNTAHCHRSWVGRILAAALLMGILALLGPPARATEPMARVVVIFTSGHLLPANIEVVRGMRQALGVSTKRVVTLYEEFLDAPRFSGQAHERTFAQYLKGKFAGKPPEVVVAAGAGALYFMLRHGPEIFGHTPIVHTGAEQADLDAIGPLPPHVAGAALSLDFVNTVEQALRWKPTARRLVVVTGASETDRAWEAQLRSKAQRFEGRLRVDFLSGLRTDDLLQRLRGLDSDAIVYTLGYFQDGDGATDAPRVRMAQMAAVSAVPLFTPFGIGTGTTGGYMVNFEEVGRQAGRTLARLLDGASVPAVASTDPIPPTLTIDWRQFQRWGLDRGATPPDAVVQFKEASLLEKHRVEVIAVIVVILLQTALISNLLLERRRRRLAEFNLQKQRHELAHASRVAMTAELTGAIAHEINQPLAAILSNADAAALGLKGGKVSVDLLREIMDDIHRDVHRASDVVGRLRALFSKGSAEGQPFDLNALPHEVEAFLRVEAQRRRMRIEVKPAPEPVVITATRIEIQQVIVNLMLNAMDAMEDVADERRLITASIRRVNHGAVIEVRDQGCGIDPANASRLFDSFFTTKANGMGLGLSISRTLVEAQEGRLTAENAEGGGALFRVELPLKRAREVAAKA